MWGNLRNCSFFLGLTGKTGAQHTTRGPQGISLYYCYWLRKIASKVVPFVYNLVCLCWKFIFIFVKSIPFKNLIGRSKDYSDLKGCLIFIDSPDLHFGPYQISMMNRFGKNSQSKVFDRVVNTPIQLTRKTLAKLIKYLDYVQFHQNL